MKVAQILSKCQVFAGLNATEVDRIGVLAEEKEYGVGTILFQEGSVADEFLVVEEGKVALQMVLPEGPGQSAKRVTVDILAANEILGWSSIVEPYVYTLAGVCLQKTKVISINSFNLRRLLQNEPKISHEVYKGLISVIADRLVQTRHVLISERTLSPKIC